MQQTGVGHNQPIIASTQRSLEQLLLSETCRMIYFGYSAEAAARGLIRRLPLWIGYTDIGRESSLNGSFPNS